MKSTTAPLMRYRQRQVLTERRDQYAEQAKDRYNEAPGLASAAVRKHDKMIEAQSPEPLTGAEKDLLTRRKTELEASIREGMPTREEMWRAPMGAPYAHLKWEKAKKRDILEWKNVNIQLEPDSDDPNLSNVERLRPEKGVRAYHGFEPDGVMPGHLAMSPTAKANWPLGEPTADTALKQAARATKRTLSPEHAAKSRAALAKAREARKAKHGVATADPATDAAADSLQ